MSEQMSANDPSASYAQDPGRPDLIRTRAHMKSRVTCPGKGQRGWIKGLLWGPGTSQGQGAAGWEKHLHPQGLVDLRTRLAWGKRTSAAALTK